MSKFLTGKKTIIVALFGGIFAQMPDWAATLPPDAGILTVIIEWVQSFWAQLAIIFGALKINRLMNGAPPQP